MVLTTDCRRVLSDNKYKMSTRIVYLRAFVLPGGILFIIIIYYYFFSFFSSGKFRAWQGERIFFCKIKKGERQILPSPKDFSDI